MAFGRLAAAAGGVAGQLFLASGAMAVVSLVCSLFARERRVRLSLHRARWTFRTGLISVDALPMGWMAFCLGFGIVPGLVSAALAIVLLPFAISIASFLVSAVLWGTGFGCTQPATMALLVDRVRGEERGVALSTFFMGFDIGIGLGAVGRDFVSQTFGWEGMWPMSAVCVLLGLLELRGRPGRRSDA